MIRVGLFSNLSWCIRQLPIFLGKRFEETLFYNMSCKIVIAQSVRKARQLSSFAGTIADFRSDTVYIKSNLELPPRLTC